MGQGPMIDPDRALELVVEHAPTGRSVELPLDEALGYCLAEPLVARSRQPPFDRALMDGYAVVLADGGRRVPIAGEASAGRAFSGPLARGAAVSIMTGAPCPPGTEAVVKVEDVTTEGGEVALPAAVVAEAHVQRAGALAELGETILPAGTLLTPLALAAAVAAGSARGRVRAAPTMAVITTGDELQRPGEPLGADQIHDSNGPMLAAMAQSLGVREIHRLHGSDDATELEGVLEQAAQTDLIVVSGGVSMGRYDLVPRIVASLGARTIFHRVCQKPGKPLLFAERDGKLIFGLPGTPLGSHLGFHRYVRPCIRRWMGRPTGVACRAGVLTHLIEQTSRRTLFRLVRGEPADHGWRLDPLRWRGSSDLVGPALANGYCRIEPGTGSLPRGATLEWEPLEEATP